MINTGFAYSISLPIVKLLYYVFFNTTLAPYSCLLYGICKQNHTAIMAASDNSRLDFQSTIPVFYLPGATKIEEHLAVFNLHKKSKYSKSIWNLKRSF
ncbi:hypothetical protein JHK82_017446 [Glycine max]|uniref:Uncharacterized protein n=1 Tax=Glycine max TaxID=3847 RepID=A0A0R0IYY2_SOYBN|nr:hypothetical protein JHK87_017392 [Glycine soja]KAG5021545.1 hypothetical protein JHK85_017887 [Glycine max]KAG5141751.1 hypothetical protein JHK82_017446 [Glycine max]